MDFDACENELLNLSSPQDIDRWPDSPPAVIATQPMNAQQSEDSDGDGSREEDGLYAETSPGELRDDCSKGTFGDEEQVIVVADQYL